MPGPARTGVLVYAKDPATMSSFYERTLGMKVVHADADHRVLATGDAQLIVHAIPAPIAASIVIAAPPDPREEQAFKPFYTVANLAEAERTVVACGGSVLGPVVGAFILSAVSEVLATRLTSIASMFFGIVIVVAVVLMPRGIAHLVRHIRRAGWRYFVDNVRAHRL